MARSVLTKILISFLVILAGFAESAVAQSQKKIDITPLQIDEDFEISAAMENSQWRQAPTASLQYQVLPNDDVPAPVETRVKVMYSSQYLYIGFISEDPILSKYEPMFLTETTVFRMIMWEYL